MKIKSGATRTTILIGRFAIKWCIHCGGQKGWLEKLFIGCLSNLQENKFFKVQLDGDIQFCPVKFCCPGGFFLIMPRCNPISEWKWAEIKKLKFLDLVEMKIDSFGELPDGKIVIVDYGS